MTDAAGKNGLVPPQTLELALQSLVPLRPITLTYDRAGEHRISMRYAFLFLNT